MSDEIIERVLGQADRLLNDWRDPNSDPDLRLPENRLLLTRAIVIAGTTALKARLQQLAVAFGIPVEAVDASNRDVSRSCDSLNDDLNSAHAYDNDVHEKVAHWLALSEQASSEHMSEFDMHDAERLIDDIREFLAQHSVP